MSKRQHNFSDADGREMDDDNEQLIEYSGPTMASQAVMAKRKVLKPRSVRTKVAEDSSPTGALTKSAGNNTFSFGSNSKSADAASTINRGTVSSSGAIQTFNFGSSGGNPFSKFVTNTNDNKTGISNGNASTTGILESKTANGSSSLFSSDVSITTAATKSPSSFGLSNKTGTISNGKLSSDGGNSTTASKLKALNENFVDKVTSNIKKAPLADLSSYCKKYLKYINDISNDREDKNTNKLAAITTVRATEPSLFSTNPVAEITTKPVGTDDKNDHLSDEEDQHNTAKIEIKGPIFQLDGSKTNKKPSSTFRFGKKPKQKRPSDDSDSEEDYSVPKGPAFNLSSITKKSSSDTAFSWGNKITVDDNKKDISENKPPFSIGATASGSETEQKKTNAPIPFNFGASTTTSTITSGGESAPFSVGAKLNSKEEKKDTAPSFQFNTNSETVSASGKPIFGFGAIAKADEKKDENKSMAPSSKFGTSNNSSTKSFNFTASTKIGENKEANSPFNFGTSSKITPINNGDKPSLFGFGANSTHKKEEETKEVVPTFKFGSNGTSTKTPFSFAATKKTEEKKDAQPLFKFGTSSTSAEKSAPFSFLSSSKSIANGESPFSFEVSGASNGNAKSKSLISGEKKNLGTKSSESSNPATVNPFSFTTKTASSGMGFKFGTGKSDTADVSSKESPATITNIPGETNVPESNKEVGEEAGKEDGSTPPKPEDVVGKGEEDENVRFSARSKYLVLENGKYITKGVGNLKVLTNKETKKSRLLLRTEGNSNVCLNSYILKDAKYVLDGKINVRVPILNYESKKLEINVIKVKDAKGLVDVIAKCQAEM